MSTAFVTGGSGFVGGRLITELAKRGFIVKALARSEKAKETITKLGVTVIEGDLLNKESLFKGCKDSDYVFHIAASVGLTKPQEEQIKVNTDGTKNILEAAKQAKVKRFIYCSSISVTLGGKPMVNADETWPYPQNFLGSYTKSKAEAEQAVIKANGEMETISIRLPAMWGKGDTNTAAFLQALKTGRMRWINGGNCLMSYCHVLNACEAFLKATEYGKPGEVYIVTDGAPLPLREFSIKYAAAHGVDATNVKSLPLWLAKFLVWIKKFPKEYFKILGEEFSVNDAKARKELGYIASVSFEEGLKELSS